MNTTNHNPLPPLPLISNHLFIDNSGWMESMSTCPRALQYKSLNLRIMNGEKPSLNFGSAIHLALEYRYANYAAKIVDETYYNNLATLLTEFFTLHPTPDGDWRTLNWAMAMIRKYNDRYPVEDFRLMEYEEAVRCAHCQGLWNLDKCIFCSSTGLRTTMVELPFAIPLYTHKEITVVYTGKIDLPILTSDGIFILDHKTTSMMGSQFFDEMKMSAQQKGYVWAFEQLTGQKVRGYYINAIRTKEVPQYVLKGKDFKASSGKVSNTETWWSENFQREKFLVDDATTSLWRNNTIDLCEEFFFNYERGVMPQKTAWCVGKYGKCGYFNVCSLANEDRLTFLNSGEYTANEWSPLNLVKKTQTQQTKTT